MDTIIETLHDQFVYGPKRDAYPERTAQLELAFQGASLELVDAKDTLVYHASITGFAEGLRLGLQLSAALPPLEDPLW